MQIYYDFNNIFIIEDPERVLKEEAINDYINKALVYEKEIEDKDEILKRCVRKEEYVIIEGHGSFRKQKLKKLILDYFIINKISYSLAILVPEALPQEIMNCTSKKLFLDTTHGGTIRDSLKIDSKVKKLCESINSYTGVKTFSSCEGHGDTDRTLYVLFKVGSLRKLENITKSIRDSINESQSKLDMDLSQIKISLNYNFGDWYETPGIFFEIRICFPRIKSKEVYKLTDLMSDLILKNKNKKKSIATLLKRFF